jgi:hypothetical protein
MSPRSLLAVGSIVLSVTSCSGVDDDPTDRGGETASDDRGFVPEGLPNTELEGQAGGLTLVAFTLQEGAEGLELFAAVKNEGGTPACEIGMTTDFYDRGEQLVTTAGGVVSSGRFYRIDDGSGVVLSCLPPGEVGMTAVTKLPPEVVLSDLGYLKHAFPAFAVAGLVPLDGVSVGKLTPFRTPSGSAYRGTLTNGLEQALDSPTVTVFPVNRVGRPLGVARSSATMDLPAAGTWAFETSSVGELGAGYAAFPGGAIGP